MCDLITSHLTLQRPLECVVSFPPCWSEESGVQRTERKLHPHVLIWTLTPEPLHEVSEDGEAPQDTEEMKAGHLRPGRLFQDDLSTAASPGQSHCRHEVAEEGESSDPDC